MKKLSVVIMITLLVCMFNSCKTTRSSDYPEPEFDKPFIYVIDTFKINGKFEDYVKLHNNSTDSNIKFYIYVNLPDTHEWIVYGTGILKDAGDTDTIDSNMSNIDNYRYFAIESLNNKNYKYQIYANSNDLHITVLDK